MSKKWLSVFIVFAVISLVSGVVVAQVATKNAQKEEQDQQKPQDLYSTVELFSFALTTIESEYVDEKTPKDLIYGSLKGMLSSLDPHSQFLEPSDYKDLKTETSGKFGGLGIEITIKDSLLTIISPIEDTPAWKEGLKAGDRIVKIGKDLTRDMTLDDAVKKLRGEPGTKVTITILRESEGLLKDFTITREIIHVIDIKEAHVINEHIGYVRITEFREDTPAEFKKALEQLKKDGADSLILDLRNNPGGLLTSSIKVSELFLPAGKTIVSTRGREPNQESVALSKNHKGPFLDWPIAILINEGSASASEIVAGALKDNKRAVIVGAKSFGKGSVQSVIPLPDGSGLRLTTAKYYTPSGKSIHGEGIEPDVPVVLNLPPKKEEDKETNKKDVTEIFDDIEKKESEDPAVVDEKKKKDEQVKKDMADNQLQAAISVIKGIQVYQNFGK
jgi:carboxyl-terminal processing protease